MSIEEQYVNSLFAESLKRTSESAWPEWSLDEIAGRLAEISGSGATAALTFAFSLVVEAQQQGGPVGWVTSCGSCFYPPDAARRGADLNALVVVRLPDARVIPRAGEKLLRSGAFALVVLDIGAGDISMALQARLAALAREHHAALVCLTEKEERDFSLGSLISLRVHARRRRISEGELKCELKVLKDKRRGPTWSQAEVCRGPLDGELSVEPAGLC
ncbi:MAG: recombinase A [Deltaproteobacteria bacterium]|nr:recombinase A [Deltaproteobacteria bacterium]MBI2538500.1 recombinase A [Deltaproteobacteria bacterium]MBI3061041.1 recombinase A [Deltaproteobacteria bacterium]